MRAALAYALATIKPLTKSGDLCNLPRIAQIKHTASKRAMNLDKVDQVMNPNQPQLHQNAQGARAALTMGTFSLGIFLAALRDQAGAHARVKNECTKNGVNIDDFVTWISIASGIHWTAHVEALTSVMTSNPGAPVFTLIGERWVPEQPADQSYEKWARSLDMSKAVAQIADLTDRIGHPLSLWMTGGVRMNTHLFGELPASELTDIVRTVLGTGAKCARISVDEESLNTGDQGNILGGVLANAIAANPTKKIILCSVLPAVHNARFIPTILAGVAKMLPGVLRGREAQDANKRGTSLFQPDGTVDLKALSQLLLVVPMTTGTMATDQPQRGMTMGQEAFGPRQPPAEAMFPNKTLGDELIGRLLTEMGPSGRTYACPAAKPEDALQFLPSAVRKAFVEIYAPLNATSQAAASQTSPPQTVDGAKPAIATS